MSHCTDIAVQATCDDASTCKKYAVQKGYWSDPYINQMVQGSGQRKQPEISRGYYARTEAIWQLICQFINLNQRKCQIVSLGAGLDTSFWRLHGCDLVPHRYIEVDFPDVVNRKIRIISNKEKLHSCLQQFPFQEVQSSLHCTSYHIVNADLRNLTELEAKLNNCDIDYSLPTLFLTECVLIYIPPENSQAIMRWVADKFNDAVFINYEQVRMNDTFGQVMITNLKARQCWLAGAEACTSLKAHDERFIQAGWHDVASKDMWTVYNGLPDKRKIERIEMLDEAELLQQLMEHYCLSVAIKETSDLGMQSLLA